MLYLLFLCLSLAGTALGTLELYYPDGYERTFDSTEAKFGAALPSDGLQGTLFVISPADGCSPMPTANVSDLIAVVERGNCQFGEKVLSAQLAGFIAVIVYDNRAEDLISMYTEVDGINISSIFVAQSTGPYLLNGLQAVLKISATQFPPYLITFIAVVSSAIFIFSIFMCYRHRIIMRRAAEAARAAAPRTRTVSLAAKKFDAVLFKETRCCICLEDYTAESMVSQLPCTHDFHKSCIEAWLSNESHNSCPLCKRDAFATETTPLLSSSA